MSRRAAFDDKRGLFAAVLARYRAVVTAELIAPLEAPDAGFDAVSAVLTRLTRADAAAPGCLVTNTACERAPYDDHVRAELAAADRSNPPPGAGHDRADAAPPGSDAVGADHRR